jgi:hypothetical protein
VISAPSRPVKNRRRKNEAATGRRTKRTPALEKRLLTLVKTGLPLKFSAASVGVTYTTLDNWRRADPKFAQDIEIAILASVKKRWDLIRKAGEDTANGRGDWKSQAWLLERCFPADFSRPEIQLGVAIQNNVSTGANGQAFQSMVLSDLEFSKLRGNPSYTHRPNAGPVRDVEAQVVPSADLSGALVRVDCPGSFVISESQEQETRRRVEKAEAKVDALLSQRRTGGNQPNGKPEPEASPGLVLAPIKMPEGDPPSSWWGQLVKGDGSREIEKQSAVMVCRIVLRETLGPHREQSTAVDFKTEPVTLGDLQAAIQDLAGPKGWSALLRKAGLQ